jgi:hypothetical protein
VAAAAGSTGDLTPAGPILTDGVVFLRPLTAEDAAEHLAGEDEEMAKWLSGGRSTLENVQALQATRRTGEAMGRAGP